MAWGFKGSRIPGVQWKGIPGISLESPNPWPLESFGRDFTQFHNDLSPLQSYIDQLFFRRFLIINQCSSLSSPVSIEKESDWVGIQIEGKVAHSENIYINEQKIQLNETGHFQVSINVSKHKPVIIKVMESPKKAKVYQYDLSSHTFLS